METTNTLGELLSRPNIIDKIRRQIRFLHVRIRYVMDYDDLFQETMLRCLTHRDQFRGRDEAELLSWCWRIGWSVAIDELRRRRRESRRMTELLETGEAPGAEMAVSTPQDVAFLPKALGTLSARERKIIELRYVRDLTFDKAGRKLGIGQAAAKQLHYRTLKKLREFLIRRQPADE